MKEKSKELEKRWKKCRGDISMKQIQMHLLLLVGNKMTSSRVIQIIIGALISLNKIKDIAMTKWSEGIGNLTTITMMTWAAIMEMVGTLTKILIHTKIKVWTIIEEEVSNSNRIRIIAINRTTTVINSRDLTNSRAEKFRYITLKLIGMRIRMWAQTQLRRLLNRNFLSKTRMTISHKPKIHKTIITILRIITTSNNEIGLILLTTRECPNNNSNKGLILNSIDTNT